MESFKSHRERQSPLVIAICYLVPILIYILIAIGVDSMFANPIDKFESIVQTIVRYIIVIGGIAFIIFVHIYIRNILKKAKNKDETS